MYIFITILIICSLLFYFSSTREITFLFCLSVTGFVTTLIFFMVYMTIPAEFQTEKTYLLSQETAPYYQVVDHEIVVKVKQGTNSVTIIFKKHPIISEISVDEEPLLLVQKRRSKNKWKLIETRYVFLLPESENE